MADALYGRSNEILEKVKKYKLMSVVPVKETYGQEVKSPIRKEAKEIMKNEGNYTRILESKGLGNVKRIYG